MPVLPDVDPRVSPALSLEREELFPIREVARLTGVNPVTLRAWERRHGLIVPTRTESGHRLYSMSDIERVRSILNWIERGVAVSKIGKILAKAAPLQALAHIIPSDLVQADYAQWQQQLAAARQEAEQAKQHAEEIQLKLISAQQTQDELEEQLQNEQQLHQQKLQQLLQAYPELT